MIDKIFKRLMNPNKIKRNDNKDKQKAVQKEYGLELKTMQFIFYYFKYEIVLDKLYSAISE